MGTELIRAALLSVSDKTGVVEFAQGLVEEGFVILSTGGTAKALRDAGVNVTDVSTYTGFPEMMDGRLKTLHPMVHGGILGREEDRPVLLAHGMYLIDVVAVNLYPFEKTVAKPGCSFDDAIENIDIGGPTMLRAAAKNHNRVTVVCNPERYEYILHELRENGGDVSLCTRSLLALEVFEHTSAYDRHIAEYLRLAAESERV